MQMRVRLVRKLAQKIDGIDLQGREVGDTLDLPSLEAGILIAEEWAAPERRAIDRTPQPPPPQTPAARPASDPIVGAPAPQPCAECGSNQARVAWAAGGVVYYRCLGCQHGWSEGDRRANPPQVHHPERRKAS
jgi:hypothetical protein